jgi:catechol 2,3-dioxygenase-like lactoylglutathione lyase family enzyme
MAGLIRLNQEGTVASVVSHVGLCVSDAAASQSFYENVFGFTYRNTLKVEDGPAARLLRVSPPVGLTAVYLELEGFVLELLHFDREGNDPARPRSFTEPGLTHLSFGTADIGATCQLVVAHGGQVLEDTSLGTTAVLVRDPDGQLLELLARG